MLYLIGLGLADEKDITVKGLEIVRRAERVYLEAYTSILLVDKDRLVSLFIFISFLWVSGLFLFFFSRLSSPRRRRGPKRRKEILLSRQEKN